MRLALATAFAALTAGASAAAPAPPERTMFLVGVPAVGSVYWRCDGRSNDRFGLMLRTFRLTATTQVMLRTGRRLVRVATVHSADTLRLPYVRGRHQELRMVQGTGAGTLRATLDVEFVRGRPVAYCRPYAPPKLTLRVFPR